MGYYTYFEIKASPEVIAKVNEPYEMFEENGVPLDTYKWYDYKEDMIKISQEFPDELITVTGEGEESGDQWVAYFKNGESVVYRREEWYPPDPPLNMRFKDETRKR
jgi:hypothetical protein